MRAITNKVVHQAHPPETEIFSRKFFLSHFLSYTSPSKFCIHINLVGLYILAHCNQYFIFRSHTMFIFPMASHSLHKQQSLSGCEVVSSLFWNSPNGSCSDVIDTIFASPVLHFFLFFFLCFHAMETTVVSWRNGKEEF